MIPQILNDLIGVIESVLLLKTAEKLGQSNSKFRVFDHLIIYLNLGKVLEIVNERV